MEYIISTSTNPTQYIKKTNVPLVFTLKLNEAFTFANYQAGKSFMTFLRNQGVDTFGFHLGQKPPK